MERVTETIMKSFEDGNHKVGEQIVRDIIDKDIQHRFNDIEYQVIDEAIKELVKHQFIKISFDGSLVLLERGFEAIGN